MDQLEAGNLSLEESLQVFEEGVGLARRRGKYLDEAEERIELPTPDASGALKAAPLALAADDRASASTSAPP